MELIKVEQKGHIKILTLNRPDALNAISLELSQRFHELIDEINRDTNTRVAIVTGTGRSFCAGADIKQRRDFPLEKKWEHTQSVQSLHYRLEMLEVPTIAAINGFALGGGLELALACDIRVAGDNCLFGSPEINLGSFPGAGAPTFLPRAIGVPFAKELLFTGRRIPSEEAYRIGLLNKVVAPEKVLDEAMKIAEEIAQNAPLALRALKKAINYGLKTYPELSHQISLWLRQPIDHTKDFAEGLRASAEKRKPVFTGE